MSELILERNFTADLETVFAFVTQTEHLLKWWGPEGMTVPLHALDFTKPGPWHSTMANSEGQEYRVSGEVRQVNPPNSVEFTWAWHDGEGKRGHESAVRFEMKEQEGGGTVFRLIHTDLQDSEDAENHNRGWTSSLRKLERLAA